MKTRATAPSRALLEAARDCRQRRLVADEHVLVDAVGRYDGRTFRSANLQRLARHRALGPRGCGAGLVQEEVDPQLAGRGIEAARREVAHLGNAGVEEEQLHVIVEAERGDPRELLAAQHDASHAGRELLDARDREATPLELVDHASHLRRGAHGLRLMACDQWPAPRLR